jgi:hypothetical protein
MQSSRKWKQKALSSKADGVWVEAAWVKEKRQELQKKEIMEPKYMNI